MRLRTKFILLIGLIIFSATSCSKPDTEIPSEIADNQIPASISIADTEPVEPIDPTEGLEFGDAEIGRDYFYGENRGRCLRCHTLLSEGEPDTFPLDDTGLRHDAEWLAIFLDNPRNLRPEVARMPPYRGDDEGATIADIVAFLMTLTTPVDHPEHDEEKPADEPDLWTGGVGGSTGGHGGY